MDKVCKFIQNISNGMEVLIAISEKIPESDWIQGFVTRIIDNKPFNEEGILVQINHYNMQGNVKKILNNQTLTSDELTEKQISETLKKIHDETEFEAINFELKETLWYDVDRSEHAGKAIKNIKLEYEVVDEICGFLNTTGGHVLIGVADNGILKGITEERDLQWMRENKRDLDHFADELSTKLEQKYFRDEATSELVKIKPMIVDGYPIIVIKIKKSYKPFFVHKEGGFKDENGVESHIDFVQCVTRRETGVSRKSFASFMEIWNSRD